MERTGAADPQKAQQGSASTFHIWIQPNAPIDSIDVDI
jgi:hypothetical protein